MSTERKAAALELPLTAVESLIKSGDGDAALLYLYLQRSGSVLELSAAAAALSRTEAEIAAAATKLRELGCFPNTARPLPQAEELPEYGAQEIAARCREDAAFQSLVGEAQQCLGHFLSGAELRTLFGIYDHLGLPPEVILLLINHCAARYAKRYGEGRLPTMRYIEREAYAWVNRELMTLDLAENFIARQKARDEGIEHVRRIMGLYGRALSSTEKRYIESWLEMGFSPEVIELAYDRTVTNTGALKWRYMNSIIESWSAKGLLLPEDILRQDRRAAGSQTAGSAENADDSEQARMERMLERLRKES